MSTFSLYARTARVYGYVVDQDNVGIELANVAAWSKVPSDQVPSTGELLGGTATNKNGYYELILEEADTVVLNFSMIGYTSVQQRIIDLKEVLNINVQMLTDEQMLTEILKHLLEGKSLTPGYAYINFGCLRLAARIADLREMRVDITTERESVNGKSFAKYSIAGEGEK